MKLLMDEMWTPVIAHELRRRALDVIAAKDPEHEARHAGVTDDAAFALAQQEGRTIVTDNVPDYERARRDWESRGRSHHGVVHALNPPFNRHRGDAVIGEMVRALEHFLSSSDTGPEPVSRAHYLHRAPRR